jgi:hypothetical protein
VKVARETASVAEHELRWRSEHGGTPAYSSGEGRFCRREWREGDDERFARSARQKPVFSPLGGRTITLRK